MSQPDPIELEVPLRRDGEGARVAIVDSGVDPKHPWFTDCDLKHVRLERRTRGYQVVPDEGGDLSGHGTACAGILHRMVPKAHITSVRALGPDGRCSRGALISAIGHAIKQRFHVVNLSLGIDVPRSVSLKPTDHRPILNLYELADAAFTARVTLVASGPNVAAYRTYPGRFKSLVGVGRGDFEDWETLRTAVSQDHELVAPGTNILAPALGGGERRWTGTSFATPFVSAHVARIVAANPAMGVGFIKTSLHALATRDARQEMT